MPPTTAQVGVGGGGGAAPARHERHRYAWVEWDRPPGQAQWPLLRLLQGVYVCVCVCLMLPRSMYVSTISRASQVPLDVVRVRVRAGVSEASTLRMHVCCGHHHRRDSRDHTVLHLIRTDPRAAGEVCVPSVSALQTRASRASQHTPSGLHNLARGRPAESLNRFNTSPTIHTRSRTSQTAGSLTSYIPTSSGYGSACSTGRRIAPGCSCPGSSPRHRRRSVVRVGV